MGNIFKLFLCSLIAFALFGFWQYFIKIDCNEILESTYSNSSLNTFEKNKFKDLLSTRYPNFDEMFSQAAIENEIEKNLLAAISFQESQWDPKAKSNMGVRGMMMVTLETAALVGVEKRLNPEQNINGGAKYFSMLQQKNKIGLTEADKLSITLASYNLGPTNIKNIANSLNNDVEKVTWSEIKNKLKTVKGSDLNLVDKESYSRGQQAIDYVNRVKEYYSLMSAHDCVAPKDQLIFF
ncbi:MAG: transglycosylase SLT domain-containing protein [Gammaproteobacteria bacterium]|tara:strand:+ start:22 stop:735 length:714 start_codon:yes stop_codon:yes gene_type:complete